MLTNALKFIKYNFFKIAFYSSIIIYISFSRLFLRISYKPINADFITKYIGKETLNNIVPSRKSRKC